jgi:hypothetical protein
LQAAAVEEDAGLEVLAVAVALLAVCGGAKHHRDAPAEIKRM